MNFKKIIVVIVILLIIVIGALTSILLYTKNNYIEADPPSETPDEPLEEHLQIVTIRNDYYAVKNCVEKFYFYYSLLFDNNESGNYVIDEEAKANKIERQKDNVEAIYNMLDEEYISYKNITKDNIIEKIEKIGTVDVNIIKMYVSQKTRNINVYLITGQLRDKMTGKISNFNMIAKLDSLNRTFSIYLQDFVQEKYNNVKIGSDIEINIQESIEKNDYNNYDFKNITDEDYVVDLFNAYNKDVLYYQKTAYEKLDKEYRNARFDTFEKFQTYAKNNVKQYIIMKIDSYKKTKRDDYTQYTCMDQNGNCYIFKEMAPMKYTVILDTYTIELPEFVEKYENSTDEEKILLNIQKCFKAINDKDYKYMYNKLDATFKANNFKTQTEFENYIKKNFFEKNNISVSNFQKQDDIYIYNIRISDDKGSNSTNKKFVMKLKEGTDFVMSFSVQ